jgi:hypothetical protein
MPEAVDRARRQALASIERTEQWYKFAFFGACLAEVLLLAVLLLVANLRDPTHLLLLAGFVGGYSIVVLAIVALGIHVSRMTQRILRALDPWSLDRSETQDPPMAPEDSRVERRQPAPRAQ